MSTTTQHVDIREMTHTDMPCILQLWSSLIEHHQNIDLPLYTINKGAAMTYERWLNRRVKEDGGRVWVAERADEIVGYVLAIVGHRSPVYETRTVGMICDLSVAPTCAREGIGSALVSHVLLAFMNQGVECVQVNYDHQNESACKFWQKMGFRPRLVEAYRPLGTTDVERPAKNDKESRLACDS